MIPETAPVGGLRRLLIIAHDYPPANSPGARRALKFSKYLPEFGWEASVVAVRSGAYAWPDPGVLHEVPAGCHVYRAFGFDTKAWLSIRGKYPGFLAWPDRSISWLPAAVVQALRTVRRDRIDVVLSTSPPLTGHCVGLLVKWMTRRPWVVELRDPWTVRSTAGPAADTDTARLERIVVGAADRIVVATKGLREDIAHRHGAAVAAKLQIVTNGYDEEDFCRQPVGAAARDGFTVAHVGELYAQSADPGVFLRAVRVCLERRTVPDSTRIVFVGARYFTECGALDAQVRDLGLANVVRIVAPMPYDAALALMLRASVLLLLQERTGVLPIKAFEYLRSNRHILTITPHGSELAQLMRPFAGVFIATNTAADIADNLAAAYRAWRDGESAERPLHTLTRYTRRETAGELARLLNTLCDAA